MIIYPLDIGIYCEAYKISLYSSSRTLPSNQFYALCNLPEQTQFFPFQYESFCAKNVPHADRSSNLRRFSHDELCHASLTCQIMYKVFIRAVPYVLECSFSKWYAKLSDLCRECVPYMYESVLLVKSFSVISPVHARLMEIVNHKTIKETVKYGSESMIQKVKLFLDFLSINRKTSPCTNVWA